MRQVNPLHTLGELLGQRVLAETDHGDYISQTVDELFEETPVDLSTFLYGKRYLGLPLLGNKQYAFVEAGTQVYYPSTLKQLGWTKMSDVLRAEVLKVHGPAGVPADGTMPYYTMLTAKWGKGSGKDTVSRLILSRLAYLLLCLKDPQKYLDIMPGDSINMLNVAYSSKQAQEIFFEPLKRILQKSLWFRDKFDATEDRLKFKKEISVISGHSEQESQEGHNLIAAVLDEIAAFKTKAELEQRQRRSVRALEHSAEALSDMVTSSATSRFPYLHKIIYISFTRFKGDFIEQKYEEGLLRPNTAFVSWGATWDVNPTKTREMFDEEYRKNPENAKARYECKPPLATDAYFKLLNEEMVARVFPVKPEAELPLVDNPYMLQAKPWLRGIKGVSYFVHVDLGLSNDRAGLAITHRAGFEVVEVERVRENGLKFYETIRSARVHLDVWTSVVAAPGSEVSFEAIREFLIDLHMNRDFNIAVVTFDRFQSADSIQILNRRGMLADLLSVDRDTKAYDTLKDFIYCNRLEGYYRERGVSELQRLNIVTGNKVDHPLQGSKDEADALAGAVYNASVAECSDAFVEDLDSGGAYNDLFEDYAYSFDKDVGNVLQRAKLEGRNVY